MKKMYFICFILLTAGVIFYFSYQYSKENMGKGMRAPELQSMPEVEQRMEQMTQTAYHESKITNITVVKLQIMDLNNDTFEEEKINTPVYFLEMEREDLINYLQEYLKKPDAEDVKRGLKAFELVKFSREEVVIRKTFQKDEKKDGYYAMAENGYVIIYLADRTTIYDYTDIAETELPEYLLENMKKGIYFEGIRELYEFLETYSS